LEGLEGLEEAASSAMVSAWSSEAGTIRRPEDEEPGVRSRSS
jgi:hypothetical protein